MITRKTARRGQTNVFSYLSAFIFVKAKNIALTPLFIFLIFLSIPLKAGPWIPVGDAWLRADIEYLADTGVIKTPITTWPMMWSNIKYDMDAAFRAKSFEKLTRQQQDILLRVRSEFRKATEPSLSAGIELASDPEVLRGFANTPREESSVFVQRQYMDDHWAYNVNLSYVNDPYVAPGQTTDSVRLDGSYITGIFGNVAVGVGWIDKWWGPGWDSSLILSNNARPRPGLFIQRNYAEAFETDWLSWMGPWTFQAFASVLDDERTINNAKLLGLSVSFKPLDNLEIGLRRTAQWGGDGRPENLDSFVDMLLGHDNCGDSGIDNCGYEDSNEPGNQLAAIDFRWRLPSETPMSLYAQIMGEDEAGYLPSRKTHQFGMTLNILNFGLPVHYYVEYSDTTTNFGGMNNITYNHSIYQSGYRYFGRSMGLSADTDSEVLSFGANVFIDNTKQLNLVLRNMNINVDNVGPQSINNQAVDTIIISAQFRQLTKNGTVKLYVDQYSDTVDQFNRQKNESRLGASWELSFN